MFQPGIYKHKNGWLLSVLTTGDVMLSPNAPLSARLSDLFDKDNWEKIVQENKEEK